MALQSTSYCANERGGVAVAVFEIHGSSPQSLMSMGHISFHITTVEILGLISGQKRYL